MIEAVNLETVSDIQSCWRDIILQGQVLNFCKGQVLCYEGHVPYGIFVIRSGEVSYRQGETPCQVKHERTSSEGRLVGLHHIFTGTPFCCTISAETDCEVLFISKTQLISFLWQGWED